MPFIKMTTANGTTIPTADVVGSRAELHYYRVMTELYGKLFFLTPKEYALWNKKGRQMSDTVETVVRRSYAVKKEGEEGSWNVPHNDDHHNDDHHNDDDDDDRYEQDSVGDMSEEHYADDTEL